MIGLDHTRRTVRSVADIEAMRVLVAKNAARTADWLAAHKESPMELPRALRFDPIGHDPLTGRPLNVIEQLNQTFTILVTLRALAGC